MFGCVFFAVFLVDVGTGSRLAQGWVISLGKRTDSGEAMAVASYIRLSLKHNGMEEIVRCDCPHIHRIVGGQTMLRHEAAYREGFEVRWSEEWSDQKGSERGWEGTTREYELC